MAIKKVIHLLFSISLAACIFDASAADLSEKSEKSETKEKTPVTASSYRQQVIDERRSNRGLSSLSNVFVPKGQWIVGFTGSVSAHTNDSFTFVVVEDIESSGYTVHLSPMVAYAFKDNVAAGGRFNYSRTKLDISDAVVAIGDEESGLNLSANDYFGITEKYSAIAVLRQYIPLGANRRFALFNEFQLEYGNITSKFTFDSPIKGTYAKGYNVGIGIAPGIAAFATNRLAAEISIGVLGLSYSDVEQTHNQVSVGEVESATMNLKINIFSIGLGVAYYF